MTTISSLTSIVEFARRGAATVVIPARAVTTRRTAAIVVIIIRSGRVAATAAAAHRRTRSVPVTGPVIRTTRASIRSPWLERWGWRRVRDVLGAGNFLTLELTAVQLLNGSRQIGGCLVFDETSAIAFATDFGIDNIESRLTGEVLKILHIEIRSSPIQ
jgi:hypothetical protein